MRPLNRIVPAMLLAFAFGHASANTCIAQAAQKHHVDPNVLKAVLTIDTRQDSPIGEVTKAGIVNVGDRNLVHASDLDYYDIAPATVTRNPACVRAFVVAWELGRKIAQYGTGWQGIASYYSTSTYYNYRYQTLIQNELVSMGALKQAKLRVPSLSPTESPWAPGVNELVIEHYTFQTD